MSGNLFADLPSHAEAEERCASLLARPGMRIERIVSTGQRSPPDFWYDQPEAEWVVLLKGAATLRFEAEPEARDMTPGDWLYIPPHRRHRIESTAPHEPTVWLAIHFDERA